MYGCESWTVKKAECWRIDAFELWCWRSLLRVPWNTRRSNQSILKEISPEYSLEGLMLNQIPILWPPVAKNWLIGKDPEAGKDWRQEEKGSTEDEMVGWHHQLNEHEFKQTLGVSDGQGGLACCSSWDRKVRHDWATELNWTDMQYRAASLVVSMLKDLPANAVDVRGVGLIPGLGRSPGEGHGISPVFLPWESSHGQRRLVGYNPCVCKESDMIEAI